VLIRGDGRVYVPIWAAEAELGQDRGGWFVRDGRSGVVLRAGDRVEGAGGTVEPGSAGWSRAEVNRFVEPDLPAACGAGIVSFHSFTASGPCRLMIVARRTRANV